MCFLWNSVKTVFGIVLYNYSFWRIPFSQYSLNNSLSWSLVTYINKRNIDSALRNGFGTHYPPQKRRNVRTATPKEDHLGTKWLFHLSYFLSHFSYVATMECCLPLKSYTCKKLIQSCTPKKKNSRQANRKSWVSETLQTCRVQEEKLWWCWSVVGSVCFLDNS